MTGEGLTLFFFLDFPAWFTIVCIWVAVRLACFCARAQRSGTRNRNRERRKADYEHDYEYDSYVESCSPELNHADFSYQVKPRSCKLARFSF